MVTVPRASAALLAAFAAAFALLTAGCSHLAPTAKDDTAEQIADDGEMDSGLTSDTDSPELDPDADEAQIGTAGPEQIENAIETLDAQTDGKPPLVSELGAQGAAAPGAAGDLFDRIRRGFVLNDVDQVVIDREQNWYAKHPTYLDRTFKRGERYLHHIVNELEARGMPLELALLPVVESAFNPVAYSRARAAGLWQFIPGTGRRYGLKQNWYYDGRRDVVAATTAALDYLEFLVNEFEGDWLLAVAAYNCGEANVARAVARNRAAGKPIDFFSLKLPRETRAYVPKLLAMRRIVADPAAHNLAFAPIPDTAYFVKVDTAGQIDLHVAAELAEIAEEELLALNPAFNHWVTDPDGPHHLLVPVDREAKLAEALVALPPEKRVRIVYHRVRSGDTLGGIADKYGVSVAALRTTNKLRGTTIHPGQDLLISAAPRADVRVAARDIEVEAATPRRSSGKHTVRRGDTLWSIARARGVSLDRLATTNGLTSKATLSVGQVLNIPGTATLAATDPQAASPEQTTYIVRAGDTLSRIANKFRVRMSDMLGWNDLKPSSVIKPGQRLVMYVVDRRRAGI
jgi:membrane-bound lytic murein transglycosylase D